MSCGERVTQQETRSANTQWDIFKFAHQPNCNTGVYFAHCRPIFRAKADYKGIPPTMYLIDFDADLMTGRSQQWPLVEMQKPSLYTIEMVLSFSPPKMAHRLPILISILPPRQPPLQLLRLGLHQYPGP